MKLRKEYDAFLQKHDLTPTSVMFDRNVNQDQITRLRAIYADRYPRASQLISDTMESWSGNVEVHNLAFQQAADEIEGILARIHRSVDFDYYIGEFPLGIINAQTLKVETGYLVLINQGIIKFLGDFSKLLVLSISNVDFTSDNKVRLRNGPTNDGFSVDSVNYMLATTIIDRFFAPILPDELRYIPFPKQPEGNLLRGGLFKGARDFIILHEFCHIRQGHLDGRISTNFDLQADMLPGAVHSHTTELIADYEAAKVCLDLFTDTEGVFDQRSFEAQCTLAGIVMFFCAFDLVESIANELVRKKTISETHPPSEIRLANLLMMLSNLFEENVLEFLPMARQIISWYVFSRAKVVEYATGIPVPNQLFAKKSMIESTLK